MTRLVTVIPSWAPERWNDRRRRAAMAARAAQLPSAAIASSFERSDATRANSAATKKPLAATSSRTMRRPTIRGM